MKTLVFSSIMIPLFSLHMMPELVSFVVMMCIPYVWMSWEQPTPFTLSIMMDKLSIILTLLTLWVILLMLFLKPSEAVLKLNILLLLLSLTYFFSVSSFLAFFMLFELSLIPTLFLVLGWGYQPERVEASFYFLFYTVTFSLPLMVSLIWMTKVSGSKYFFFNNMHEVCSGILGFLILLVFMIKLPLFLTHLWLPKAHVEAPVVGSMILAAILLKTGGYGIIRVFLYMSKTFTTISFLSLGSLGMVYICLVCLYSMDLKQMIAYSSVSHMNFMVVGLMNNSQASYTGSVLMMVSHGLCSSLMFMLVDFSYKRLSSRSILVNKGMLNMAPSLSMVWSFTVLFNMSVPPSVGSLSELLVISSCKSFGSIIMSLFVVYLFLAAFYSVYLYMCVNHGSFNINTFSLSAKELFMSFSHLLPLAGLTVSTKLLLM